MTDPSSATRMAPGLDVDASRHVKRRVAGHPTLGLTVVLVLWGITWMLSHGYQGIVHDARLYTLQALAHGSPASLSNDVFLHFGSQDRYTIFSPLYAALGQLFGTERAASLLTLVQQLALLAGAWLVARQITSAPLALLGVSVLMAMPGDYGPERILKCIEPFLTPRMAAEALVLASLAAALNARRLLACGLLAAAVLFHPIMAAAGIAALFCLYFAIPQPSKAVLWVVVGTVLLVTLAYAAPAIIGGRFDPAWLALIKNRSPYLFLSDWKLDDWSKVIVTLATLVVGAFTLPNGRSHSLSRAALMTTVGGLGLTLIACDLLHLVVLTQLQPWRCQWLGTIIGALVLPPILNHRWQSGTAGRATALLLVAAWIFGLGVYAVAAAAAAVLSMAIAGRLTAREARLVYWGAIGMLLIAIVWRVATNLEFTEVYFLEPSTPLWLRKAMSLWHDGTTPMALIAWTGWLSRSETGRPGLTVLAAVTVAGFIVLVPSTWARWTTREFPPQLVAQYADWRRIIPSGANVFWGESPVATWLLLDRPSYLSAIQTAGMVFSRDAAMEMERRADALASVLPPPLFLNWNTGASSLRLSSQQLLDICRLAAFDFLVTPADLHVPPAAFIPGKSGPASKGMRLYHCPIPSS